MAGQNRVLGALAAGQNRPAGALVTGEGSPASAAQPGGRTPAPGDLALVQEFLNTHYDLSGGSGEELLSSPPELAVWLSQHGLLEPETALSDSQLARALTIREGFRSLASGNAGRPPDRKAIESLNSARGAAAVELDLAPDGPNFLPAAGDGFDRAMARLIAIVACSMLTGTWARLKACPGEHCGWAFYDHSRNRTGRWCSMSVCGGRAKAKAHYRRRHGL